MYQVRVINKDGLIEATYNNQSYDRALNKFVKVVTIQEETPLEYGECIKVEIADEKMTYLTNIIRGQKKDEENDNKKNKRRKR